MRPRHAKPFVVAAAASLALSLGGCTPKGSSNQPGPADVPSASADASDDDGANPSPAGPQLAAEAPRRRPEPTPVQDRDAALVAVASGNPEGAADFLKTHVEGHADDHEAALALARARVMLGRYDDAIAALQGPDTPDRARFRAQIHRLRGRLQPAKVELDKALAAHPNDLSLQGELLDLLIETGRGEAPEAKRLMDGLYDAYERGDAKTGAELLAVARAALARGTKGGFHDANMVLGEAERAAPVGEGTLIADLVLLERGDVFLEKYAEDEAITTFGLVLERDAWQPDALAGQARVYVDALQFAAAARSADEALQVNPKHPEAHAALARIALIEGRREEARKRILDEVLQVDPLHVSGLAVLAGLAILENDQKGYTQTRDRALQRNPKNGRFFKELSDILGFLHLYPEADTVLTEAVELAPNDPYVHGARGLNLLRLGNEEVGRKELEVAWKQDPFNERTRNMLDLYQNSIDPGYELHRAGDLTLRLPKNDQAFVQPLLVESVQWSRKALDEAYKVKAGALRLEFFEKPEEFSVRTVGVPSLGAVAVCFGPLITFMGPYHGLFNVENVIRHELGHVYAIQKSKGRVPRWFTEGLSEWESELADPAWARESAELLDQARRIGKLRRLGELELAFIRAESPAMMEVAYSTAAYAVRYLGKTYGRAKLVAMLEGYAKGKDTDALFVEVLGKPIDQVEREFETWFFAELDAKVSGWHPSDDPRSKDARDALWRRAVTQASENQAPEASRTLEKLIHEGGDGYAPRMLLAQLLLAGPKPQAAERHFEFARKHHKEAIEPLVELAELARARKDVQAEKKLLIEALGIEGDALDPAARLYALAVFTGDKAAAKRALRRARGTAPLHPLSLAGEAMALHERGKPAEAKAALARAAKALAASEGAGPVDTWAVAALAADEVGDEALAKQLASKALAGKALFDEARKRLEPLAKG